jgi:hypothetical protein
VGRRKASSPEEKEEEKKGDMLLDGHEGMNSIATTYLCCNSLITCVALRFFLLWEPSAAVLPK